MCNLFQSNGHLLFQPASIVSNYEIKFQYVLNIKLQVPISALKSDTEVTSCKSSGTTNGIVATVRTVLCIGIIVVIVFTTS